MVLKVTVSVEEDDVLKRVALLNAAMFKVLMDSTLIRVASADYKDGCIELLVESNMTIVPDITPGEVTVKIERVSRATAA